MIAYFEGLGKGILINKERKPTASTITWPLLMALNHLNSLEQYIEDENQLLWEWVKQLEHKTVVVIGKPTQTNTLQQVKALSLTNKGHPEQVDPYSPYKIGKGNSKKNWTRDCSGTGIFRNLAKSHSKKTPRKSKNDVWECHLKNGFPSQTAVHVTAHLYMATEWMALDLGKLTWPGFWDCGI